MKFIQELREGERISQIYLCKTKTTATTKMGKNYYSLLLQDKTGTLDGKIWDLNGGNCLCRTDICMTKLDFCPQFEKLRVFYKR